MGIIKFFQNLYLLNTYAKVIDALMESNDIMTKEMLRMQEVTLRIVRYINWRDGLKPKEDKRST